MKRTIISMIAVAVFAVACGQKQAMAEAKVLLGKMASATEALNGELAKAKDGKEGMESLDRYVKSVQGIQGQMAELDKKYPMSRATEKDPGIMEEMDRIKKASGEMQKTIAGNKKLMSSKEFVSALTKLGSRLKG